MLRGLTLFEMAISRASKESSNNDIEGSRVSRRSSVPHRFLIYGPTLLIGRTRHICVQSSMKLTCFSDYTESVLEGGKRGGGDNQNTFV